MALENIVENEEIACHKQFLHFPQYFLPKKEFRHFSTSDTATNAVDYDSVSLVSLIPAWTKYCIVAFIGISSLIGIPGNSLVASILLKQVRKTTTDWFIIFIAIFDTLSLVVSGTSTILVITPGVWDAVRSTVLCRFHIYMSHFFFIQSLYLITAVGIDRYVKTCKPHSTFYTPKSAFRSSLVAIVVSAACSIPFYFTTHLNKDGDCVIDTSRATLRLATYSVVLLCVLVSSVALVTWYTKIALQIRRRVNFNPKAASSSNKAATSSQSGQQKKEETELPSSALSGDIGMSKVMKVLGCSQEQLDKIREEANKVADDGETTPAIWNKPTSEIESEHTAANKKIKQQAAGGSKPILANDSRYIGNRIPRNDNKKTNTNEKLNKQASTGKVNNKQKQASKTTKIMASITIVYILSTTMPTVALAIATAFGGLKSSEVGRVVIFTMMRMYLINNFINPIFYITLSSVFRRRVAEALSTCRR